MKVAGGCCGCGIRHVETVTEVVRSTPSFGNKLICLSVECEVKNE